MKKAFLSHGWCDADSVAHFAQGLEVEKVPVFLDKWDIEKGAMVWQRIDEAIDKASKLVLFLSRDALNGKGVQEELDRGLQKAYERHGSVFIVPVGLEPYEDLSSLLPIRVRGGNMIRAWEQPFEETIDELKNAILNLRPERKADGPPPDFFYRLHRATNGMLVELGSGIQMIQGFSIEVIWPEPVKFVGVAIGPVGKSSNLQRVGVYESGAYHYIPKTPETRLCFSYYNGVVKRGQSFYLHIARENGSCPADPIHVRLYDRFHDVVRDPVQPIAMPVLSGAYCFDVSF